MKFLNQFRHIREKAAKYKKKILYPDTCGGQNRIIKMTLIMLKLLNSIDLTVESTV